MILEPHVKEALREALGRAARAASDRSAPLPLAVSEWLDEELGRLDDMAFAERFHEGCPVPGARARDYLNRIITHPVHGAMLVGPRFMGGRLDAPFVDLIATEAPLATREALASARDAALDALALFDPARVRLLTPLPLSPALEALGAVSIDQVLAVGSIATIASRFEEARSQRVSFRLAAASDLDALDAFVTRHYEEHFKAHPGMESWLYPASREELEECLEDGAVILAHFGGEEEELVGLLAAREMVSMGHRGWWVIEELVLASARGQRLGARMQGALARHLHPKGEHALLCGTIDARNLASRHTARHAGREEITAYVWLERPRPDDHSKK